MAFDTKQYIIDLVKQLNLRHMDEPRRAQLKAWQKDGRATGKQKKWDPDALLPSCDDAQYGTAPTPDELKEIYQELLELMRALQLDSSLSDSKDVKDFFKDFYGAGKVIEPYKIKALDNTVKDALVGYLKDNKSDLARFFKNNDQISAKKIDELIAALDNDSYQTNVHVQQTLQTILEEIDYAMQWGSGRVPDKNGALGTLPIDEVLEKLKTPEVSTVPGNLLGLVTGRDSDGKINARSDGKLDNLFDRIVTNDKLREAVVARGGDVAKWVSKGMAESNYKDGTDKVPPKIADKKRLFGRAANAVSGYYNNTWGKLFDKHKRHVYRTDARYVVEALFKANIKPTDGLGKVVEKLDDIANSQPGPVAKQIKWMKATLEPMSKTTQFKEALTHGGQMQKVVSDVITAAAHDGSDDAMQAAEMTLETLAMMQSTMVTSGVREELYKMDFTIFSDPSMSFNKGAMGIFTKALDKTLRFATLAAYEVGNFVANAIKKTGGKIKKDKIKEAAGKAVSDEDMRRIELQVFWNFINSNANTDLNVLKRHFKKQNAADEKAKDEHGNDMAEFKFEINGEVRSRKDPTVKEVEFLQYMIDQGYANAA